MTKKWNDIRLEFKRLYVIQDKPLEEVRKILKDKYGFNASLRAYKTRIDRWGWMKHQKGSRLDAAISTQRLFRSDASVSSVSMSERIRWRELGDLLKQQAALARKEKALLFTLRELAIQDLSDDTNVGCTNRCDENIARVERIIKSLEVILKIVTMQINTPTGFASCWKQQPMMLEDAHGTFIAIPLEKPTFASRPGFKKVTRREYVIEDSTWREFSRDQPWISYCKAGLKIDMSMVFKDESKTSAICPKCDTISHEQPGIMAECKNLGCGMLFRTEEEEDRSIIESQARGNICKSLCIYDSSTSLPGNTFQTEEEEPPGSFKRVIVRIGKGVSIVTHQRNYSDIFRTWEISFRSIINTPISTNHIPTAGELPFGNSWDAVEIPYADGSNRSNKLTNPVQMLTPLPPGEPWRRWAGQNDAHAIDAYYSTEMSGLKQFNGSSHAAPFAALNPEIMAPQYHSQSAMSLQRQSTLTNYAPIY